MPCGFSSPFDHCCHCALAFQSTRSRHCSVVVHLTFPPAVSSFPVRGISLRLKGVGNACDCNGISLLPVILLLLRLDRLAHVFAVLLRNAANTSQYTPPAHSLRSDASELLSIYLVSAGIINAAGCQNDQHNVNFDVNPCGYFSLSSAFYQHLLLVSVRPRLT